MSKQPQMIVVDFEIELDKYQLTDYGISEATSIYCSLITEEKYSNYQEMDNLALLELSAKEDKALRRFVDKDLKTKILQYKKKQMRPLLMLDAIMETVKELIMNYSEKHSYLSLAEIAVTGDVTTFQNPEFENTLNSLTLEAKQALIDSLGFESDDELVDYLMNLYDDPFGLDFDAFDDVTGKLSFALAILNNNNDGIILTSLYGHNSCNTYVREVVNGETPVKLLEEEKTALNEAKNKLKKAGE